MDEPNKWMILKCGDTYRVFATWSGGYLDSDSYKLNSGIESYKEEGEYYLFLGYSGSIYKCRKTSYGTTGYGSFVLADWGDKVVHLKGVEELPKDIKKL